MANKSCGSDPTNNCRGSSRDYPKSEGDSMNPGRGIKVDAGDLQAKNLSPSLGETKIPKKRL